MACLQAVLLSLRAMGPVPRNLGPVAIFLALLARSVLSVAAAAALTHQGHDVSPRSTNWLSGKQWKVHRSLVLLRNSQRSARLQLGAHLVLPIPLLLSHRYAARASQGEAPSSHMCYRHILHTQGWRCSGRHHSHCCQHLGDGAVR